MFNLNKYTKTKSKHKPTCKFKNCSHVCASHRAQPWYTTQHKAVLIIFPSYPPDKHQSSDAV